VTILPPIDAARIAATVYEVESSKKLKKELKGENPFWLNDIFEFRQDAVTKGKSGPTFLPAIVTESGFGYVARGKGNFAGDTLLAFRGTNFVKARDVWTDANLSVQKGPRGHAVHGGFNDAFNSILPRLREQLDGVDRDRPIHLVGHSLGGAIATIAMDWCKNDGFKQLRLYTFGCPRVGPQPFARALTEAATAEHVYRVHHTSDVVSMIPLFPFVHAPLPGEICAVARNGMLSSPISVGMHFMDNYIESVRGRDWKALRDAGAEMLRSNLAEAAFKKELASHLLGRYSALALYAINDALTALLVKTGEAIGCAVVGGMTILDQLVWALTRIAEKGGELVADVSYVSSLALRFMSVQTIKFGKLSIGIIRDVRYKLFSVIYGMARMAIEAANAVAG